MGCNSSNNIPKDYDEAKKVGKEPAPKSGDTVRSRKKNATADDVSIHVDDIELSSDCVIELERGKDEVELSSADGDYPDPEPSSGVVAVDGIKPATQWYTNWMPTAVTDSDDTRRRPGTEVSVFSHKSKRAAINFASIDKRAREASVAVARTYNELISYLTEGLADDPNHEILVVRAIIVWMSTQNADGMAKVPANTDSPIGYLKLLQQGRATYSAFFTVLCRRADIACVQVDGYAKCADYQPGDSDMQSLQCNWNVVHVGGAWRVVHPFWICRALIGHQTGGWIKLETDGKIVGRKINAASGTLRGAFKEYYFFTNPSEFIYRCFPIDEKWQLLQKPISLERFTSLPYLLPPFFGLKMKLKSKSNCLLKSKNGVCNIEIQAPELTAHEIDVTYDLFLKEGSAETEEESRMLEPKNMQRLVLSSRNGENFSFETRFPVEGKYKLVVYGGPHNYPLLRLLECRMDCDSSLQNCCLIPFNPNKVGWGPGPTAESAGLFIPSHRNGVISVNCKEEVRMKFQLDKKVIRRYDVKISLIDSDEDQWNEKLKNHIKYKVEEETRELIIYASVPGDGEYAMVIGIGLANDNLEDIDGSTIVYKNVCNYFLSTWTKKKYFDPSQRMAKCKLEKAVFNNSLDELDDAIRKCEKFKVPPDDDELVSAKKRLEYLKLKRALQETFLRRNLSVTKRTLKQVTNSIYRRALSEETRRAELLQEKLELLGGFTQEVPALEPALAQIYPLVHPPDEVHNTMEALFLIINEPEDYLDDWGYIQILLKERLDPHKGALHRMRAIPDKAVDEDVLRVARKTRAILSRHSEEQVKNAHLAAASIYRWTDGVIRAQMSAAATTKEG
ncbi:hypothetical protein ScPMuIL_018591 [Solemya velum]